MSGFIDVDLTSVKALLNTLTWKKIAQVFVFVIVVSLTWAAYETRDAIYKYIISGKTDKSATVIHALSTKTIKEIDQLVNRSGLIIGIQVSVVDFQRNVRYIIYVHTDVAELRELTAKSIHDSTIELPLFSNNAVNNRRLVDLINGEFTCNKYTDTMGPVLIPNSEKYVDTICSNGIPPFYGKFIGIVSVYTSKSPTDEETAQIRALLKNLSNAIYDIEFRQ